MIKLTRPLVFFDLETTGVSKTKDRIVEIAIAKLWPDGKFKHTTTKVNPTVPIPKEATAVHGITNEMVANEKTFAEIAPGILKYITNCDLSGFNIKSFDIPLLAEEFFRAGIDPSFLKNSKALDVRLLDMKLDPRTLSDRYRFYTKKELEGAHGAEKDTLGVKEILEKMLENDESEPIDSKKKIGDTIESMVKFIDDKECIDLGNTLYRDENGDILFNIGEDTKGKKVLDNRGMLEWMLKKDFITT